MTYGVCGCTIGPPANGKCAACGATGPGYVDPYRSDQVSPPWPGEYGRYYFTPNLPSADDIRRIIREELERAANPKSDG